MIGLAGIRVLVVDDKIEEAAPLLRALGQAGIPVAYFNGDASEIPDSPFPNVRLALLDVDLLDAGQGRTATVAALVNLATKLISKKTAGLILVLWTRHSDWATDVWNRFLAEGGPIPIHIASLSKEDFKDLGGTGFDIEKLKSQLQADLASLDPWTSILSWEEAAREASSNVTSELTAFAELELKSPTNLTELVAWQVEVRRRFAHILTTLASSELGKENIEAGEDLLRGAYMALSPVLQDEVEHAAIDLAERDAVMGDSVRKLGDGVTSEPTLAARLNTRWSVSPETKRAWTGNIYEVKDSLMEELLRVYPDFGKVLVDHLAGIKPTTQAGDAKRKREEFAGDIFAEILVDIHPACDHAQRKIASGRLLAGVRLTPERAKKIDIQGVWTYGPLWDEETAKPYSLAIDLKRPLACSEAILKKSAAWRRLRHSVMVDLLAAIASHAMRPGTRLFGR